jgi:hypothetical protein
MIARATSIAGTQHIHPIFRRWEQTVTSGWGVDRKRLTWFMVHWCTRNPKCFTCFFRSQYRSTRKELFPILSRIQNIGYELGENDRTPQWYRSNHRTPWVANCASMAVSFKLGTG